MHSTPLLGKNTTPRPRPRARFRGSEIMIVGGVINVVENMWSVGETMVKRGNWRGQRKNWEMLSTITSVISGRTKICDIDMLLIIGTSSLFSNMMQTVHELTTLLPLHWANITLHLDLVYVVILLMVLVFKKRQLLVLCRSTRSYILYVHVN